MPFPPVMDSTARAKNRGTSYAADQYMLLCSNTVVLAARINGAPTGTAYAHVTFDTVTTGAYTSVQDNMTVYISHANNIKAAYFRGRARFDEVAGAAATSTTLYINETSQPIADNDYLFVVRDFGLHPKFAKATTTTYTKDYNRPYAPPAPMISGLQSAYAGVCDPGTETLILEFNASPFVVASGASISSSLFAIPASGVTVIDGSLSSNSVTLEFDAAAAEYWISFKATDDNGQFTTMRFPVWAIPSDLSTTIAVGFDGASLDMTLDDGAKINVNAFEGVEAILDQTLAVLFEVENYNDETGSIVTDIKFVGRYRREGGSNTSDEQASRVLGVSFEIEGMSAQLARTPMEHIKAIIKDSPAVWDEIANLTPWRAICHILRTHTTFCEINSLSFDDVTNTYLYPSFPTMGNSVLDAIKDILESLNAGLEWAQSGEARIGRDLRYTSSGTRNAADTVMNFGAQDFIEITSLEYQHVEDAGLINGYAGSWSTASETEMIAQAKWPGITAGEGVNSIPLNRQVVAANVNMAALRTEIRARVGYQGAVLNTRYRLTVVFPDQYNWLTPSRLQWYTWTLSVADQDNLRHNFTTAQRWLCETVSIQHDNTTGSKTVTASFIMETPSYNGQDYDPPSTGGTAPFLPDIPPIDTYPTWPDLPIMFPPDLPVIYTPPYIGTVTPTAPAPMDGSVHIAVTNGTESLLWVTRQGLVKPEKYIDITPPLANGERIYDAKLGKLGILDCYVLASDGETSHVYYLDNVLKNVRDWQTSEDIDGYYIRLALTDSAGEVYIQSGSGAWEKDFDFTIDEQGWSATVDSDFSPSTIATYTPSTGWTQVASDGITFPSNRFTQTTIEISWAIPTIVTGVSFEYEDLNKGNNDPTEGAENPESWFYVGIDPPITYHNITEPSGSTGWGGGPSVATAVKILLDIGFRTDGVTCDGTGTIVTAHLEGIGNDPFGSSSINTRFSNDFGSTFDSPISAGSGTGTGGIDTEKIGDPILIGTAGQVKIATTKGGAYSDYGDPVPSGASTDAIFISRLEFGSTTVQNIETITPEFLLGSSVLSDDDEAFWKVDTGGTNFIDITPVSGGNPGTVPIDDCIAMPWRDGRIILGILDFDGTRKLVRTLNSGGSWAFSSALDEDARCIVTLVNDKNSRQLWFAGGANGIGYLSNYKTSLTPIYRKLPTTAPCIIVDVYL